MDPDSIARILDRANDLLEAGKPAETLRCLAQIERAALDDDNRIEAGVLRAWALSELGNHDAALAVLEPLMADIPDSGRLHAARGVVLSNADELDEAQDELEEAYELNENDEATLANLALVYEKRRDFESANMLYERALTLGADIDWLLQRKAAVQTELGEYAEAKATLRRYLSLAPEDGAQWVALGILHSDDEEYDKAFECYAVAEKTDVDWGWLHLNWGVTAVRAGKLDLAAQQLELLGKRSEDAARLRLLEAFVFEERGEEEQAAAAHHAAVDALSDSDDTNDYGYVLEMSIEFFARRGRRDECTALLRRAYLANACTVELCEAYREALGRRCDEASWFGMIAEADYRPGLIEVRDSRLGSEGEPTRFIRSYQVVGRDRDEATALLLDFMRAMGEGDPRVREFTNDEPMEDIHTGIYEVERRCLVFNDAE